MENYNRKLFAQWRDDEDIADPYTSLVSLYSPGRSNFAASNGYPFISRQPSEDSIPTVFPLDKASLPKNAIASREEFLVNWRIFTENSLGFLDWSNVLAAGGSVLACMSHIPDESKASPQDRREYFRKNFPGSDVDL